MAKAKKENIDLKATTQNPGYGKSKNKHWITTLKHDIRLIQQQKRSNFEAKNKTPDMEKTLDFKQKTTKPANAKQKKKVTG